MARVSILLVVLASVVATLDSTQAATFKQCTPLRAKQAEALLEVRVVKILDGDTVDVQLTRETRKALPYRVRLAEIDAPEKDQPFGKASSTLLGELVNGKSVTCVTENATDTIGSSADSTWQINMWLRSCLPTARPGLTPSTATVRIYMKPRMWRAMHSKDCGACPKHRL